jgi:hypothetical protein
MLGDVWHSVPDKGKSKSLNGVGNSIDYILCYVEDVLSTLFLVFQLLNGVGN